MVFMLNLPTNLRFVMMAFFKEFTCLSWAVSLHMQASP